MRSLLEKALFCWANLLIPVSLIVFAKGFFPYKPFLPGLATFDNVSSAQYREAPFDRVVFMVVDALRSDFVYAEGSGFQFTQSLIRTGSALPFTGHASSPTITMPRVKAITTGSVPSFLDVILNFAESDTTSTLAHQDTWLAQLKAKPEGALVMYGDDTWLKLFPDFFKRADGTTSFFVSDFTEVDNNVTRHIPDELANEDWSGMIMHFLGLDHIGHKAGPNSPNMLPKQMEMDSIVRQIYTAIETKEHLQHTLLVLCGDHGMNDAGNHGGSAPGETSPALTFISPKMRLISHGLASPSFAQGEYDYYKTVEQSDVAPTLAGLLGFPVPRNNLGIFITDLLGFWEDDTHKLDILRENAAQIKHILQTTFTEFTTGISKGIDVCRERNSEIQELACLWVHSENTAKAYRSGEGNYEIAYDAVVAFSRSSQDLMSGTASNYDVSLLHAGTIGISGATLFALGLLPRLFSGIRASWAFLLVLTIFYCVMMFASSYVEEEQQFWYWMMSGWVMWLQIKSIRCQGLTKSASLAVIPVLTRILRRWNQTGQKFAGEPDIANSFLPNHRYLLWSLIMAVYLGIFFLLAKSTARSRIRAIIILIYGAAIAVAFLFKISFTAADSPELLRGLPTLIKVADMSAALPLVSWARLVFGGLALALLITELSYRSNHSSKEDRQDSWNTRHLILSIFLITQTRTTSIPIFLALMFITAALDRLDLSNFDLAISCLVFQYTTFFALGGSNAISSVDLSNAYNGVSGYNVVGVGVLVFISNWAGPIWWVSATSIIAKKQRIKSLVESRNGSAHDFMIISTLFTTASTGAVVLACLFLRTHLFIWTVFSPKFLFCAAWAVANHLLVNLGFGALVLGF